MKGFSRSVACITLNFFKMFSSLATLKILFTSVVDLSTKNRKDQIDNHDTAIVSLPFISAIVELTDIYTCRVRFCLP